MPNKRERSSSWRSKHVISSTIGVRTKAKKKTHTQAKACFYIFSFMGILAKRLEQAKVAGQKINKPPKGNLSVVKARVAKYLYDCVCELKPRTHIHSHSLPLRLFQFFLRKKGRLKESWMRKQKRKEKKTWQKAMKNGTSKHWNIVAML